MKWYFELELALGGTRRGVVWGKLEPRPASCHKCSVAYVSGAWPSHALCFVFTDRGAKHRQFMGRGGHGGQRCTVSVSRGSDALALVR